VCILFQTVESSICKRTTWKWPLSNLWASEKHSEANDTSDQEYCYHTVFLAFLAGVPPRRAFRIARRKRRGVVIIRRNQGHGSPGNARVNLSVSVEEDMRQTLADIDSWIKRIKDLANGYRDRQARSPSSRASRSSVSASPAVLPASGRSGPTGNTASARTGNMSLSRVRRHGEILHRALIPALRTNMGLYLRLERDHANPAPFEQFVPGPVYLGNDRQTSKFLILVSDEALTLSAVLANVYPISLGQSIPELRVENYVSLPRRNFHTILDNLEPDPRTGEAPTPVVIFEGDEAIVLHRAVRNIFQLPQSVSRLRLSTIFDLAPAHHDGQLEILRSHKKRLSMATTIAHDILQLQETGWLPPRLSINDLYYHGRLQPESIDAWLLPPECRSYSSPDAAQTNPFECVRIPEYSTQLISDRDRRLSTMYHCLGIALFELGHGRSYLHILRDNDYDNDNQRREDIYAAINNIDLGRTYHDVVQLCLTGRLLQGREDGIYIDRVFNEMVLQR
jgi:hypothetical protein